MSKGYIMKNKSNVELGRNEVALGLYQLTPRVYRLRICLMSQACKYVLYVILYLKTLKKNHHLKTSFLDSHKNLAFQILLCIARHGSNFQSRRVYHSLDGGSSSVFLIFQPCVKFLLGYLYSALLFVLSWLSPLFSNSFC